MATKLMGLSLDELSFVDRPANKAARVTIHKRDDSEEYWKREFSGEERERLAGTGAALPDGSFPIKSAKDVRNAVHALGRASNPAKAKAHIIRRAEDLGVASELPDGWTKSLTEKGEIMDTQKEVDALKSQVAVLTSKMEAAEKSPAQKQDPAAEGEKKKPNPFAAAAAEAKEEAAEEEAAKRFNEAVEAEVAKRMKKALTDEFIKIVDPADATKTIDLRKSEVGEATFAMFKSQNAEIQKAKDAQEMVELTKEAETNYGNLTGKASEKAAVLKAMKGMPEEVRKTLDAMLKSGNAAMVKKMSPIGQDGSGSTDDPTTKLETMVADYATKNSVNKAKAYDEVLKTAEGKALYRESLGTPKTS